MVIPLIRSTFVGQKLLQICEAENVPSQIYPKNIPEEARATFTRLTCGQGHCGEEQDGEGKLHLGGGGVVVGVVVGLVADITCRVGLMLSRKKIPPFMGENAETRGEIPQCPAAICGLNYSKGVVCPKILTWS